MALNDITFIKGEGGLGRPLAGQDYISGLLLYAANNDLPSGWTTSNRVRLISSLEDAENNGITNDSADATGATFTLVITAFGAVGNGVKLVYSGIYGDVTIVDYKVAAGVNTIDLQGAAIAAAINANTYTTNISATYTAGTDTLTITLPKSEGIYPTTGTTITKTQTGTFAATLTQPTGGAYSLFDRWHYQIAEFFRANPKGLLYVGFYPIPATYDYEEVTLMQTYADGKIRQIGVFVDSKAFAVGDVQILHDEIVNNNDANHMPLSAIYAGDYDAITDWSTLTNLNTYDANKVSVVIAQDGKALGNKLWKASGVSSPALGAALGAVSFASVSDDIAWVAKFNASNGRELDTPALGNGDLIKNLSVNLLSLINNYRYIFLRKFVDLAGSYWNDDHTAIIQTSDYAYISNNRTIDKAIRGVYSSVLPALASPLQLNADGTLTDTTIAYFTSLAQVNLFEMLRNREISAQAVTIDPTQNVLSTNTLEIAISIVPIGVARNIVVKIGFTTSI